MILNFFHQAEFFQLFNRLLTRGLGIHARKRRVFVEGGVRIQNVYQRQVVALADLKVVEVMRRRNFNRAGTFFGIGMLVTDNRNRTVDNRKNRIFAD